MSNNEWHKRNNWSRVHDPMCDIETQETQPLPNLLAHKPTLTQLRLHCRMDVCEVARKSGVRPNRVYLMEHGSMCTDEDVWRVLMVLSLYTGQIYRAEDVRGLRVKTPL